MTKGRLMDSVFRTAVVTAVVSTVVLSTHADHGVELVSGVGLATLLFAVFIQPFMRSR